MSPSTPLSASRADHCGPPSEAGPSPGGAGIARAWLTGWAEAVLGAAGLAAGDARLGAERLVLADAIGITTHGVARLPTYWEQLRAGALNPRPHIRAEWQAGVLVVDGDLGLGQVVAARAFAAAQAGLSPERAFVPLLVRAAGHLGALGGSVLPMAQAGLVAFLSQATQPVMAPRGARRPAIGNNPLAFAAPRPGGPPLLCDFAASVTARGHVLAAARDRRPLQPGWAIDAHGRDTLDAEAALAGSVLPAGGHKGLVLAMIVQTLAGALTGARPARDAGSAAPGCGAFGFLADPAAVRGAGFGADMADWIDTCRASGAPDLRIPGERAAQAEAEMDRHGITLAPGLAAALRDVGRKAGVPFFE